MPSGLAVDDRLAAPDFSAKGQRPLFDRTAAGISRKELTDLMCRVAVGDRAAFDQVHRRTRTKLFGIAMKVCCDRAAAEDVLADVYVLVWRGAKTYQPGLGSPISWLAAVTRNRAIDWRRAYRPSEQLSTDLIETISDPAPSTIDNIIVQQDVAALRKCFDKLPCATRDAIREAFFEGTTYAQLAENAGVPLGTMKSIIRRGLQTMRAHLSN